MPYSTEQSVVSIVVKGWFKVVKGGFASSVSPCNILVVLFYDQLLLLPHLLLLLPLSPLPYNSFHDAIYYYLSSQQGNDDKMHDLHDSSSTSLFSLHYY